MATQKRLPKTRRTHEPHTRPATVGVVRLTVSERGVLSAEPIDSENTTSHQLMADVSGRIVRLGSGGQAALRTAIQGVGEGLVLVAEPDSDREFPPGDLHELLMTFVQHPGCPGESGLHVRSASLLASRTLIRSDEAIKAAELEERAAGLRRRALTSGLSPVTVPEMGPGVRPEEPEQQKEPETSLRLPKAEVSPEVMEDKLRRMFREYAKAYPERVDEFSQILLKDTEAFRTPSKARTLGLTRAAQIIGINHNQLKRYFDDPEIEIGSLDEHGRAVFSEYECLVFIPPDRGRGRPKKRP